MVAIVLLPLSCLLCLISSLFAYRLFFHPLSRIPGPRMAALSNVWYALHVRNGRVLELSKSLHKTYGPIVRIGPNELWFNNGDAFDRIYSVSQGYPKSDFYLATALHKPRFGRSMQLEFPDSLDLLSERDLSRYRLQRRLIGPVYQSSNLLKFEGKIDEVLQHLILRLEALNGQELDLTEWMHITVVEILSAVTLSSSPGYLRAGSDGGSGRHTYIGGWRLKSVFGLFPWATIMGSYSHTFKYWFEVFLGITFRTPKGFKPFFPFVSTKGTKRVTSALRAVPHRDLRQDLAADLIQLHKDRPEFTQVYLKRMITTNFGAGHETTTSALTSVIALVSSQSATWDLVSEEIRRIGIMGKPLTYNDALDLACTQAAIREALRLYPVLGMSPSRKVPPGGAILGGYYVPAGTTVGCNPFSLHRNSDIFGDDAEEFRISRWFDETYRIREMTRYDLSFGGGGRQCPGRNLANLIVLKVVTSLIMSFNIKVEMPPEDEYQFYFMAMLTGIKVRFRPRLARQADAAGILPQIQ